MKSAVFVTLAIVLLESLLFSSSAATGGFHPYPTPTPSPEWVSKLSWIQTLNLPEFSYSNPCEGYFITNAKITTFDPALPEAKMVRVFGSKITWVGNNINTYLNKYDAAVRPCKIINAQGRRVGPAIWDSHVHLLRAGIEAGCQIYEAETAFSLNAFLQAIQHGKSACSSTEIIGITGGFSQLSIGGVFPTRQQLDAVVPNQPFIGAQRYRFVDSETFLRDGPGFTNTKMRDQLNAAGFNLSADGFIPSEKMNPIILYLRTLMSKQDKVVALKRLIAYLHSKGIVGGYNMPGGQFTVPDDLETVRTLYQNNDLDIALGNGLLPYLLPGGIQGTSNNEMWALGSRQGENDALWNAGYAEYWFSTGALGNETQLTAAMQTVRESNQKDEWILCVNSEFPSNGPGTFAALQNVAASHGIPEYTWTVEHLYGFNATMLQWLKDHKIFTSFEGIRFLAGRDDEEWFRGPKLRTAMSLSNDPLIALGTDGRNAAPINWWISAQFWADGRNATGHLINAAETIPIKDIYRFGTYGTARKVKQQNIRGTITAGKLADLVLWKNDPLTVPTNKIRETQAKYTFFRGRLVYSQ